jgi:hypothetical protein
LDPSGYHEHATTITEQISTSRSNLISWGAAATDRTREIAILLQFLAIGPDFVRKGCAGRFANRNFTAVFRDRTSFGAKRLRPDALQIAILPQLLAIEHGFVRKGCVSCRLVGTAPRRQERNRKEAESKRARENLKM